MANIGLNAADLERERAIIKPLRAYTCTSRGGLIAQGDYLLSRCQGWTDDMARQRGWAPEAG